LAPGHQRAPDAQLEVAEPRRAVNQSQRARGQRKRRIGPGRIGARPSGGRIRPAWGIEAQSRPLAQRREGKPRSFPPSSAAHGEADRILLRRSVPEIEELSDAGLLRAQFNDSPERLPLRVVRSGPRQIGVAAGDLDAEAVGRGFQPADVVKGPPLRGDGRPGEVKLQKRRRSSGRGGQRSLEQEPRRPREAPGSDVPAQMQFHVLIIGSLPGKSTPSWPPPASKLLGRQTGEGPGRHQAWLRAKGGVGCPLRKVRRASPRRGNPSEKPPRKTAARRRSAAQRYETRPKADAT